MAGLFGGSAGTPKDPNIIDVGKTKFAPPAMRLFIVRKRNKVTNEVEETRIEAHQFHAGDAQNVLFFNLEDARDGEVTMRTHRVFFNVEEVEEVDLRPSAFITH